RVAAYEPEPPARHVVGLRRREELDANFLRAGHLEERRRLVAIEREIRIGEIVDHHQSMLPGEVHDADEKIAVHAEGGRVVRERQDQELRFGQASRVASWSRAKKSSPGRRGTERRSPSAITTE